MTNQVEIESNPDSEELILKTFAIRLREARRKSGLSQAELGQLLGVKATRIVELETGISNVTLKTLAKLAQVLGRDARYFLPDSSAEPLSNETVEALSLQLGRMSAMAAPLIAELGSFDSLRQEIERHVAKT